MRKFDLQLFSEVVAGKKIVYLFRLHKERGTETGATIAFTTENERTKSSDTDSTPTKDGNIQAVSDPEVEITATALLAVGDTMIGKLEDALDDHELLDIWEANLEEPADGTYALTSDQAIDSSKTYYTRSGTSPNYTYTAVASPVVGSIGSYYEMTATKFKGRYFQGYLSECDLSSNADDNAEVSLTFAINGKGVKGNVTVTSEQQDIASYVFIDTTVQAG